MQVLITPRSFGKNNPELFTTLTEAKLTLQRNDTGAILSEEAMIQKIQGCSGLIVGVDPVTKKVLDAAKELKAIAKYGVGLDNIDLAECERRHIKVSRTIGANSNAVADYTFTLMLAVARKAMLIHANCQKRNWQKITSLDVYGKTLGIIGLGAVGKCVAKRAQGFSMQVLAYDVFQDEAYAKENHITYTSLEELLRQSDVVTLHAQLTPENHKMINKERLELMKKTAILINTARGDLIEEEALALALKSGQLYGAGLDVFCEEPPHNPIWYELDNVVLGSHCSSSTLGATETMGRMACENLLRDLDLL
ncbi:MAG: phosphoglycerate dehydrogenase [Desulfovibrionaceae bacterium]|nr:phosphoglycerate dehydrogenase [Desulfovibrionaceae bacterium]